LLKAKRYDEANFVKREILSTKRTIISERSSANPENAQAAALDSIQNIQARMKTMMILAESMDKSSSSIIFNNEEGIVIDTITEATFQIPETNTTLTISSKNAFHDHDDAKVVWTNEAIDLSTDEPGVKLLAAGGSDLIQKICALDTVAATEWGPVKCATGDSVLLKDVQYVEGDTASRCCILLAVPPLNENDVLLASNSTGEEGKQSKKFEPPEVDSLQYMETGLRSTLRSIFRKIQSTTTKVEVVTIPTATFLYYQKKNEENYDDDDDIALYQLRCHEITLKTVVEEIKRGAAAAAVKKNKLKTVHLVASSSSSGVDNNSSGSDSNCESNQLIKLALEMGLLMTVPSLEE